MKPRFVSQKPYYLLTNTYLTVLGAQALSKKWNRRRNWGTTFLFLTLLAQPGSYRISTSTVKGIPSHRRYLRMDRRNFRWRFSQCGSIHCHIPIQCCTVWRPVHAGCAIIPQLCHLWYSFGGYIWEPPSEITVTEIEDRPEECYGTGGWLEILKHFYAFLCWVNLHIYTL